MNKPNINTFAPDASVKSTYTLPSFAKGSTIIIVGAGAFGGWSALHLLRAGYKVILIDAYGPGNSRSSSGDETRVIRSTYGSNEIYFDLNVRALQLWKESENQFQRKLFHNTGVLWFCYDEQTPIIDESIPFAKKHNMPYEYLSRDNIQKRFPLINGSDLHHAYLDHYGGYLKARESCQAVTEAFIKEGGQFIQAVVAPGEIKNNRLSSVKLSNHQEFKADAFIFACGAWLGKLFPEVLSNLIICTKQETYYLGVPAQYANQFDNLPVWIDVDGDEFYYGICNNAHRGFKIGIDKRGEIFDPSNGEREITQPTLAKARRFLAHRFPLLKDAPLIESRVCPYENSPDGNFIFDLHPQTENLFFLGGGSGHGFKHGPALGELVMNTIAGNCSLPELFSLKRF
jgi:glycine/D-amino acid oxidase-like deaminating enzyme